MSVPERSLLLPRLGSDGMDSATSDEENRASYNRLVSGPGFLPRKEKRSWPEATNELNASKRSKLVVGPAEAIGPAAEGAAAGRRQGLPWLRASNKRNLSEVIGESSGSEEFAFVERLSLHDRHDYDDSDDEDDGDGRPSNGHKIKRNRIEAVETRDKLASPAHSMRDGFGDEGDADYHAMNSLLRDLHRAHIRRRACNSDSYNTLTSSSESGGELHYESQSQQADMNVDVGELTSPPLSVLLRDLPSTRRHEHQYRCRLEREQREQSMDKETVTPLSSSAFVLTLRSEA